MEAGHMTLPPSDPAPLFGLSVGLLPPREWSTRDDLLFEENQKQE